MPSDLLNFSFEAESWNHAAGTLRTPSNRLNSVSARRLYDSVRDILRAKTHNTHGRRVLRGIQIIPETTQTGAGSAEAVQE